MGKISEDWGNAYIVSLYKCKGGENDCTNYEGISLLNTPGQVRKNINNNYERIKDTLEGELGVGVKISSYEN